LHAQFLVSPLDRLALNRRFDVITIIDVLLHVVDNDTWRATLSSLSRHLKPTGVFVILDSFAQPGETWSRHCHPRSLPEYTETLADLDLGIAARERFDLAQEGSTKDLIAVVRNGCA
jgi:SAM-dependent methyltransferase